HARGLGSRRHRRGLTRHRAAQRSRGGGSCSRRVLHPPPARAAAPADRMTSAAGLYRPDGKRCQGISRHGASFRPIVVLCAPLHLCPHIAVGRCVPGGGSRKWRRDRPPVAERLLTDRHELRPTGLTEVIFPWLLRAPHPPRTPRRTVAAHPASRSPRSRTP